MRNSMKRGGIILSQHRMGYLFYNEIRDHVKRMSFAEKRWFVRLNPEWSKELHNKCKCK